MNKWSKHRHKQRLSQMRPIHLMSDLFESLIIKFRAQNDPHYHIVFSINGLSMKQMLHLFEIYFILLFII